MSGCNVSVLTPQRSQLSAPSPPCATGHIIQSIPPSERHTFNFTSISNAAHHRSSKSQAGGRCLNAQLFSCLCVTGAAEISSLPNIVFALQLLGCATSASPALTLHFTF